jgi:hypothetical protein
LKGGVEFWRRAGNLAPAHRVQLVAWAVAATRRARDHDAGRPARKHQGSCKTSPHLPQCAAQHVSHLVVKGQRRHAVAHRQPPSNRKCKIALC